MRWSILAHVMSYRLSLGVGDDRDSKSRRENVALKSEEIAERVLKKRVKNDGNFFKNMS